MSTQHTPGPWTIAPSGTHIHADFPHTDPNSGLFSRYGRFVGSVTGETDTDLANARLFSAAPELLAALENVLDTINRDEKVEYSSDFHAQIVSAIAKAKGGAA